MMGLSKSARVACAIVFAAQIASLALLLAGRLPASARNLVPQAWLGGLLLVILVLAYELRGRSDRVPSPPDRLGPMVLSVAAIGLIVVYFVRLFPWFMMPYDLGCWSEPIFILDIIKHRTGTPLYQPPQDSNSITYTFGAPALTYLIAWAVNHPASIPAYRFILQFYLAVAAVFAAAAGWQLLRLTTGQRHSRIWWLFFALASFLFVTNSETASHNVYLHNEPLVLLVSALAFWLMVKHAATAAPARLWAMAIIPALGFLVKQYLAVWLATYVIYLFFQANVSKRQKLAFSVGSAAILALTIGACLAIWGQAFYYWVIGLLSTYVISFHWLVDRSVDSGWLIALAALAAWLLVRDRPHGALLGIVLGWIAMLIAGIYTMGAAPYTIYLGPATLVGWCFFLVALAKHWPGAQGSVSPALQWAQLALATMFVVGVYGGLGHPRQSLWQISEDIYRYAGAIEREFEGLPAESVLLDMGDWPYLARNLVMKDRATLLTVHRDERLYGLLPRIRNKYYRRILVHHVPQWEYLYDLAWNRGIRTELQMYYREVRRIPPVKGMGAAWPYTWMMMSEVSVLEPVSDEQSSGVGAASAYGLREAEVISSADEQPGDVSEVQHPAKK